MARTIRRGEDLQKQKERKKLEAAKASRRNVSGRKVIGETKKVSITLPHGAWEELDQVLGEEPRSAYLRRLILTDLKKEAPE